MIQVPFQILRTGCCQYSDAQNYLDKDLTSLIAKVDEYFQADPLLKTVRYKILIEGSTKKGVCPCSLLKDVMNDDFQKMLPLVKKDAPICYDIIVQGVY